MFKIKKGTAAHVVKKGLPWMGSGVKKFTTRKELIFEKEEVVVDPVGNLGCNRRHGNTIGGAYALSGYFTFLRDGYYLIVHLRFCEYID